MYITVRMSNSKKITGREENLIFFKDAIPNVEDGKIPCYSKEVNLQDGTGFRTL